MTSPKDHNQDHPANIGIRFTIIGIISNLVLGIIKGLAGFFGNSYALIADAIESLSDVAGSFIVWSGLKISAKAPDKNHPYGHGKAEPIATFIVSLSLFVAAIIIVIQSIKKIITPHEVPETYTLWVIGVVIITKEILFKKAFKIGEEINSGAIKSDAWHHRADALTSLGALIGVLIAIIGGKGYESADDWAAILTSGFIMYNAFNIGKPALSEIMDIAPPREFVDQIKSIALNTIGVKAIDKCFVRKMGFDYYVDIHVVVDGEITVREGHAIAHDVKERLENSKFRIQGAIIHIEPFDPEYKKM